MKRKLAGVALVAGLVLAPGGRTSAEAPKADAGRTAASAEETAALEAAQPVFEMHCHRCHTKDGRHAKPKSLRHLDMDRYPFTGHHAHEAGRIIRKVLTTGKGKGPTMPSDDPGAVRGDELARVLAWADAFDRAHPPKKKPTKGDHHHH
jgi:mono/diheme cytochrome c family protein